MRWFRLAFAIALDRASKPAGYDGLRRLCTASVARLPFWSPPSGLDRDERTGRLLHLPSASTGTDCIRTTGQRSKSWAMIVPPSPTTASPGRGAERVQVNLFPR